jgi:REP element-mobilizing transposase RayT
MDVLPVRKHLRLKEYDDSQNGCYFVTICTKDKMKIFGEVVGRADLSPPKTRLSEYGKTIDELIQEIPHHYDFVEIHKYVVMPNLIHILIIFDEENGGGLRSARPTLQTVMHALKTLATKRIGLSIWQTSFHEHIIRDEADYLTHWQYIDNNPAKWAEDEYYFE